MAKPTVNSPGWSRSEQIMPTPFYFIAVVLIWSTTPLAITISSISIPPQLALLARMLIGFIVLALIIFLFRKKAYLKKSNYIIYFIASLGLFPTMNLVYEATAYLSSGLMSVYFALTPILSGILACIILKEPFFSSRKIAAIFLSVVGVIFIFFDQITLTGSLFIGVLLMTASNITFCLSQIGVKLLIKNKQVDPFEQTLGALLFSLPGLFISWLNTGSELPGVISVTSFSALIYLALVGSIFGFVAYFHVLSKISVSLIALIPILTPVLALWLGVVILDEVISLSIIIGTSIILIALTMYDENLSSKIVNIINKAFHHKTRLQENKT